MELDFEAGNLVEDEAGEVEHNVSVILDFLGLLSSLLVDLIMGPTFE